MCQESMDGLYSEVRDSFNLAMKAEGINKETRDEVLATVDDAVGNL